MTNEQALSLLKQVRALLDKPEHWTKQTVARNDKQESVETTDESATCWCVMGAFWKLTNNAIRTSDMGQIMNNHLASFNDKETTTHADIVRLLDARINKFEQRIPEGDIYD